MQRARFLPRWRASCGNVSLCSRSLLASNLQLRVRPFREAVGIATIFVSTRRLQTRSPQQQRGSRKLIGGYAIAALTAVCVGLSLLSWPQQSGVFNDPPSFTPFLVTEIEPVSPTSFILTLRPKSYIRNIWGKEKGYNDLWKQGIWAVEFKQPELQIARLYTPLPPHLPRSAHDTGNHKSSFSHSAEFKSANLRFLIRVEPDGEVSRYLQRLPVGAKVELRGPHYTTTLPSSLKEVTFLAGGTGIAPALQVAHTLLEERAEGVEDASGGQESKKPFIHIIWANRRQEDCIGRADSEIRTNLDADRHASRTHQMNPVVRYLQQLQRKHPHHLRVDYTVDAEGTHISHHTVSQLVAPVVSSSKTSDLARLADQDPQTPSRMILVSGPEGFVKYVAGPKVWANGEEKQGPLGGILKQVKALEKGWSVWKL